MNFTADGCEGAIHEGYPIRSDASAVASRRNCLWGSDGALVRRTHDHGNVCFSGLSPGLLTDEEGLGFCDSLSERSF